MWPGQYPPILLPNFLCTDCVLVQSGAEERPDSGTDNHRRSRWGEHGETRPQGESTATSIQDRTGQGWIPCHY